jgi:AcrR family transcriptional regulator
MNGEKTKKAEQSDITRKALLAAARGQFSRYGYAEVSLDDIAQAAGVTKGALYHHFSSKEELFRIVFGAVKKELSLQAFPIELQNDGDVWHDLVWRCRTFIEAHTDPQVQRIVLLDARWVLSWDDWHKVESEYGVVMLRGGLRRAMHRGIIAPQPLASLSTILTGALTEACMLVANADDRATAIDNAAGIIERLLEGLRLRTGEKPGGPPQE